MKSQNDLYRFPEGEILYRPGRQRYRHFACDGGSCSADGPLGNQRGKRPGYKYYSKHGNYFFLEKNIADRKITKARSLFQALNVRENAIVGIYFAKRLLVFSYRNGALIWRFTSDDIEDKNEINNKINELGLPENNVTEIYGANVPLERLRQTIDSIPPYRDLEEESKRNRFVQIAASTSLVALSALIWGGLMLKEINLKHDLESVRVAKKEVKEDLKIEYLARLPLYLEAMNVPLDQVIRALSFLEGRKYSVINATSEHGKISGTLILQNPEEAYRIKESIKDAKVNIRGGTIEISFTGTIDENTHLAGRGNYRSLFDIQ